MTTTAFLNKSEASHYLHTLYEDHIELHGLEDMHPSFDSILTENLRDPVSPSAIEQGYPRGNRGKYSVIDHLRISGRPMYSRSTLKDWFDMHYAPKLTKAAA